MKKDGHTDVASSRRMCKMIIEDANDILDALPRDSEAALPTWWTNKLAKCSAYINGARDYLVYSDSPMEETREDEPENDDTDSEVTENVSEGQVSKGDYTTRHFDICPSAQALYSEIEDKTEMVHLVVESMMLHDLLFKLEKQAIAMDNADEDMVRKAQHYADMIMSLAREMRLEEEHSYVEDVHMAKIKELAMEDEDDMLPPSAKMVKHAS
jgi:putative cell wall-binding protein